MNLDRVIQEESGGERDREIDNEREKKHVMGSIPRQALAGMEGMFRGDQRIRRIERAGRKKNRERG